MCNVCVNFLVNHRFLGMFNIIWMGKKQLTY